MAIKGADLLHVGDSVLIERAQTAGPGNLNIPTERVYELGNYQSLAVLRDIPDLTYSVDSLDSSSALEALLVGGSFVNDPAGTQYDLSRALPLDVMGQFKPGRLAATPYDVLTSVALPFLTLEQVNYRFGLHDKAQQTAQLRGDSIYYNPGSGFMQTAVGTGVAGQTVALANPAYPFNGDVLAGTRYALGVSLESGKRLLFGVDYTETVTPNGATTDNSKTVSVVVTAAVAATDKIKVIYSSPTQAVYPQLSHTPDGLIKPAAIRGKDIQVFIGGQDVTHRFHGVQSVQADYRVTLQKDEEFGSIYFYAQDFDVPDVTGQIDFKARDPLDLYNRIAFLAGVSTVTESVGALTYTNLSLDIVLHSPIDGHVLKTIYVPDASFTLPSYQGRVQQKLTTTFSFESATGEMYVYAGARP